MTLAQGDSVSSQGPRIAALPLELRWPRRVRQSDKQGTLGGEPRVGQAEAATPKRRWVVEGWKANDVTDLCTVVKGQVKRLPSGVAIKMSEVLVAKQSA